MNKQKFSFRPMSKVVLILLLWGSSINMGSLAFACSICEKQQPRILRGITHGAGPQSRFDYVIIWIMVVITMATLYYSVKWLVRPGEKNGGHIKRFILNEE
ncbi:hypothetical protein SAMN05192529_11911 [Arachidicoccus rhizosphaerae]|uniref:Uncharacterized protein n=1 Tax=Arachidicoccus rhizosphaerae TaxID=551991 RepID=A0A1H4B8M2_9BACT|nr:hypothetical protein [Arachidicoccus rhizosphaerae]SEA44414.1 hypothetical protein SAMN05192529_11911 [Arachidicoccus rhizosphaerae]